MSDKALHEGAITTLKYYRDKLGCEAYFDYAVNVLETVGNPEKANKAPTDGRVPVSDLIGFVRTCREELFDNMKNYSQEEFTIRDSMLTNFEQIVRLASSSLRSRTDAGEDK